MKGDIPIELVLVIMIILVAFGVIWAIQNDTIKASATEGAMLPLLFAKKPPRKKGAANFELVGIVIFFVVIFLFFVGVFGGGRFIKSILSIVTMIQGIF